MLDPLPAWPQCEHKVLKSGVFQRFRDDLSGRQAGAGNEERAHCLSAETATRQVRFVGTRVRRSVKSGCVKTFSQVKTFSSARQSTAPSNHARSRASQGKHVIYL